MAFTSVAVVEIADPTAVSSRIGGCMAAFFFNFVDKRSAHC
jgi:hypothetical protein